VLAAYDRDDREGFAAFRRAEERSGVRPPDLPELEGSTWLEVVLGERVEEWVRSRGQSRQVLVEPLVARLRDGPVAAPAGAAEAVAPLRWLLARAGEGIAMTQKGNLARALVIEAVERFGWQPLPNPPRGEDDVFELWVLRDLARDLGAVRRSGRRLVATCAGRALAGDAEALWRAVAQRLGGVPISARSSPSWSWRCCSVPVRSWRRSWSSVSTRRWSARAGMTGPPASRRTPRTCAASSPSRCGCWACSACPVRAATGGLVPSR
jgi:hypothetical protein